MEIILLTGLIIVLGVGLPMLELWIETTHHPRGWLRRKFSIYSNYFGLGI